MIAADRYPSLDPARRQLLDRVDVDLGTLELVAVPDGVDLIAAPVRAQLPRPIPAAHLRGPAPAAKSDCPLCDADAQAWSDVWHAYGEKKDTASALRAAQDAGIIGVTAELVARHLRGHRPVQPAPAKRINRETMLHHAQSLTARDRDILLCVYRQRALSTQQLVETCFLGPGRNKTIESARKSAYRALRKLAFRHMLYQFHPTQTHNGEIIYFPGRWSAPLLEEHEGRLAGDAYVTDASRVREQLLAHDLGAAQVFVLLARQLYAQGTDGNAPILGRDIPLELPHDAWLGARSLAFDYTDPFTGRSARTVPDGFAALSADDRRSFPSRMPFFYEWDSGRKPIVETVEQILDYAGFAAAGVIGQRMPQLAAPGYFPPVLVVAGNAGRAYRLLKEVREAMQARAVSSMPPVYITDVDTISASGWLPGAWRALNPDEQPRALADILHDHARPLIDARLANPGMPFAVDLEGARSDQLGDAATLARAVEPLV